MVKDYTVRYGIDFNPFLKNSKEGKILDEIYDSMMCYGIMEKSKLIVNKKFICFAM